MTGNEFITAVGLGYVGLSLAVGSFKRRSVVSFDINSQRIRKPCDSCGYVSDAGPIEHAPGLSRGGRPVIADIERQLLLARVGRACRVP